MKNIIQFPNLDAVPVDIPNTPELERAVSNFIDTVVGLSIMPEDVRTVVDLAGEICGKAKSAGLDYGLRLGLAVGKE
jgi:hypothetical protein